MKQLFQKNLSFFIPYILVWLAVLAIVLTTNKLEQMQWINSYNNPWGDWFFYGATQMGEGWFWGAIIVLFLFIGFETPIISAFSNPINRNNTIIAPQNHPSPICVAP